MKLKGLLKVALVLLAISTMFVACDTLAGGKWARVENVYMKPSATADADSVYYVWNWGNGADGKWSTQLTLNEDGLYVWAVPEDADNCIFVEMEAETTEPDWSAKVAQTADLVIPLAGDTKVVYSIASKEWIELGAKEPEPEPEPEPVVGAVVSEADFKKFTHIAGDFEGWANATELNAEKSYKFFATSSKTSFKFTDGTWAFCAITSEEIVELDKEYVITKIGDTGMDNINVKNLEKNAEYEVSLTWKDDKAYVKVHATGEVYTPPANCGIVHTPEAGKIYLVPSDNWLEAGVNRFCAVFTESGWKNETWVSMTKVEGKNLYEVTVPQGNFVDVQFQRMNPDKDGNDWDSKWSSSETLQIPTTGDAVVCVIDGWTAGSWMLFATE